MLVRGRLLAATIAWLAVSSAALAQGHRPGEGFIAARVGANLVGNTYRVRQSKPVAGAGVSGGVFLSPSWAAEFEVWSRSSNPDCCAGRERLFSLSAERLYSPAGIQPYLAGGLALLRSQIAATRLQVQVTAGVRVPVVSRVAVDLDLRGNGGGSTMIVRPTIAAVYFFN
jgi:opacity protein-like surface antigen